MENIWRRVLGFLSLITVEPVEFIYCLMFTVSSTVRDNLFIDKVCLLDKKYPEEVCYNMTHGLSVADDYVENVQQVVTNLEVYDGILVALPSVIFCLFLGAWSDTHGRKIILILPFVGNFVAFIAYMINYAFFYELSIYHLLWGSSVGLFGGYIGLNIALYGYIGDITDSNNRTMRMSILNGVFSLGYVVGTTLGGKLYKRYANYYLNFGISCGLSILGVIYTLCFIKESLTIDEETKRTRKGFFNFENVIESLKTAFKPRTGSGRIRIILLIINFAIFMFPMNTTHYDYLLVMNRYDWDVEQFSQYLSVQRICRFIGLFLLLPFFSRVLHIKDSFIAAVGTILTMFAYLIIAIGQDDWKGPNGKWDPGWIMFLSAAFQLNSVITVTIRSQSTKEVDKEEIGRIFSVVALGQALVPLIANPMFGGIYKATLDYFEGSYLFTVDALLLFVFGSSLYMFWDEKRRSYTHRQNLTEIEENQEHILDCNTDDSKSE